MQYYLNQFEQTIKAYSYNYIMEKAYYFKDAKKTVFSIHFFDSLEETANGFHEVGYIIPSMGDKVNKVNRFNNINKDLITL